MTWVDLHHNTVRAPSISPAAHTATVTGTTIDLAGFDGAEIYVDVGHWTDGTHTISLLESSNDSSYTTVAADDLLGSAPVINSGGRDNRVYQFGYRGSKRYVRPKSTVTGGPSTGAVYGMFAVLGAARHAPVDPVS